MLTFNDLLTLQGVDPAQVRLVRHQDRRLRAGRLYEAWRNDRTAFEAYQSAQVRDVFPIDAVLASFIVTDARKTVFVGMYRVDSVGSCPPGTTDALLNSDGDVTRLSGRPCSVPFGIRRGLVAGGSQRSKSPDSREPPTRRSKSSDPCATLSP